MRTLYQGDLLTLTGDAPEGATFRVVGPTAADVELPFDTSELPPGRYRLLVRYEGASTADHVFMVLSTAADAASPEAIVAAIDATILGSATANQQSLSIGGRSLSRYSLSELTALRSHYARLAATRRGRGGIKVVELMR